MKPPRALVTFRFLKGHLMTKFSRKKFVSANVTSYVLLQKLSEYAIFYLPYLRVFCTTFVGGYYNCILQVMLHTSVRADL